jgi:hypothetical protein
MIIYIIEKQVFRYGLIEKNKIKHDFNSTKVHLKLIKV